MVLVTRPKFTVYGQGYTVSHSTLNTSKRSKTLYVVAISTYNVLCTTHGAFTLLSQIIVSYYCKCHHLSLKLQISYREKPHAV